MPTGIAAPHFRFVKVGTWPMRRLRLCRDIDFSGAPFLQRLADDRLAPALAVELGRVDKIDAALIGIEQRLDRVLIVYLSPVAADLPRAECDFADLPVCPSKASKFHTARSAPVRLLARRCEESLVHGVGRSWCAVVKCAEPFIQGQRTIVPVVALEVLVMKVVKEVVRFDRGPSVQHDALK